MCHKLRLLHAAGVCGQLQGCQIVTFKHARIGLGYLESVRVKPCPDVVSFRVVWRATFRLRLER